MSAITYNDIALQWQPAQGRDRGFNTLTVGILVVVLILATVLSVIPVPEEERRARATVPPRIAQFISEKPKPAEPVEKPEPKPLPPPSRTEPEPTIKRERPSEAEQKPLTEAQKTAREKAQNSGLLALHNELFDLMDTSEINSMVAGDITGDTADAQLAAGHELGAITAGAVQGGGGIDSSQYGSRVSATKLSAREVAAVRSGLFADVDDKDIDVDGGQSGSGNGRSKEDVTIVFDQNKGTLYSLYARERRRSPGLQGKIVLKITIAPSGTVTDVEIVSSELNSPSLEAGIIGRIKLFRFDAMEVDEMTVTYPIEFLPS
jgi:protein TonB